jgi:hypothetical protein
MIDSSTPLAPGSSRPWRYWRRPAAGTRLALYAGEQRLSLGDRLTALPNGCPVGARRLSFPSAYRAWCRHGSHVGVRRDGGVRGLPSVCHGFLPRRSAGSPRVMWVSPVTDDAVFLSRYSSNRCSQLRREPVAQKLQKIVVILRQVSASGCAGMWPGLPLRTRWTL